MTTSFYIRTLFLKDSSAVITFYFHPFCLEFDIALIAAKEVFISAAVRTSVIKLLPTIGAYL